MSFSIKKVNISRRSDWKVYSEVLKKEIRFSYLSLSDEECKEKIKHDLPIREKEELEHLEKRRQAIEYFWKKSYNYVKNLEIDDLKKRYQHMRFIAGDIGVYTPETRIHVNKEHERIGNEEKIELSKIESKYNNSKESYDELRKRIDELKSKRYDVNFNWVDYNHPLKNIIEDYDNLIDMFRVDQHNIHRRYNVIRTRGKIPAGGDLDYYQECF